MVEMNVNAETDKKQIFSSKSKLPSDKTDGSVLRAAYPLRPVQLLSSPRRIVATLGIGLKKPFFSVEVFMAVRTVGVLGENLGELDFDQND